MKHREREDPEREDRERVLVQSLQEWLDHINAKRGFDKLKQEDVESLGSFLHALLYSGESITVPRSSATSLVLRREGPRVRIAIESNEEENPLLGYVVALAHAVNALGADRVRQCQLEGCGRWFIARKAQQYCTYVHAQRDRDRRKQEARNE